MNRQATKVTERGWGGHFICAGRCQFRRNTLIESETDSVVVSTVGLFVPNFRSGEVETIGAGGRYYETMAFGTVIVGKYTEANVSDVREFDSPWKICANSFEELPDGVDNIANFMHDEVVREFLEKLSRVTCH